MRAYDELEIRTASGVTLPAVERSPELPPRGVVVLVHGLGKKKEAFEPLSSALVAAGFQTIAFDFHDGDFETLARGDLAAVVECVRARADDRPLVIVARGLGARIAVAAQASGVIHADALVLQGGSAWWRLLAATPLTRQYRMLAGAAFAVGKAALEIPCLQAGRSADPHRVLAAVERALTLARS